MLREIVRWWMQQMGSLLPSRRQAASIDAVIVRPGGGTAVELALRRRGVRQALGAATLDETGLPRLRSLAERARRVRRVILELPGSMLLEQEAALPLAAERELSQVLTHEMDRLTPFRAADIFWSWTIIGRDAARGRLLVRLSIVLKTRVTPFLQGLAQAGLVPSLFEVVGADGGTRQVGVAAPGSGRADHPLAVRVAASICGGLAVAALLIPLAQQQWALSSAERQITELQPRVALVEGLRRRVAATSSGAEFFAAEAARSGNAVQALAAVTRALPDDSYLTEFTFQDRKLTLAGRSEAAVRLIGLLATAPGLTNPAFAAPVFRMVGDHGDQFTISAGVAP